ncbi:hypothetical protein ENUP19_0054G0033 [Entamoeba nuttalli]|uniref:Cleavage and polyadenylation specificity factor 73 kDa subunit, putative n=2 Tax=Entamoeba nuttalli TaxID=412467 RepID=K2H0D3_ENTNP|nr:cleavage and polyadenylation specificity factor 73 kDa subunit, putative [Entamoeba nuttalli P19]EKE40943.1 cleavage and polyadenylation specificity factor 73 kDa subunit, putative [Entamoeba nuttalli P19]|eukprot:XP_008856726.1 cleavage and polyadenylation specificity factor 73 kDa subunit, putative [Entamoeba nuttalli P19]
MSTTVVLDNEIQSTLINGNYLEIRPLGAGREVGRSCFILKYMGHNIMLDCGVHPAKPHGEAALPLFEHADIDSIELLCVTHYHVDHCASLPYLILERQFKGKVLMTPPTKEIFGELFKEFHQMSSTIQPPKSVNPKEVMDRIDTIKFHELQEYNGMKIWCFNAGHILGAAMFCIEINGVKILYTGDFSGETDRHLQAAEVPPFQIDVMMCESTYGIIEQESRIDRENAFIRQIIEILKRGGKCLIPVFSLGRAQEFELILEEYWQNHKDLWSVSIFFFSSIAKKCTTYFEKFTSFMNQELRKKTKQAFDFKFIREGSSSVDDGAIDYKPCVVMASPGMLQDGISRKIFERWCTDKKNGVIIPGYCVEGTLAKDLILDSTKPFINSEGDQVVPKCSVTEISFCAHSDFAHTRKFIGNVKPKHLVLIHGEGKSMEQLHNALKKEYPELNIYMPCNTQPIKIPIQPKHEVRLLGEIASNILKMEEEKKEKEIIFNAVYLQNTKDVDTVVVKAKDVERFSSFHSNEIYQHLYFPCLIPLKETIDILKGFYPETIFNEENNTAQIKGIQIKYENNDLCISWQNDIITDILIDHIIVLLLEMGISEKKDRPRKIPQLEDVSLDLVLDLLSNKFESAMVLKNKDDVQKAYDNINQINKDLISKNEVNDEQQKDEIKSEAKDEQQKDETKQESLKEVVEKKIEEEFCIKENVPYILVHENSNYVLVEWPSLTPFGFDKDLLKRLNSVLPKILLTMKNTF